MTTPYQDRKISAPALNVGDEPYFDAAAQGRLLLKKCLACGEHHHYPRAICPFCFSDRTEWVEAKGTGTLFTFSVTRRGVPTPYALAYVTLDEGVSVMTNFADCDLDTLQIGQKMKVVFKKSENGLTLPMFAPASAT